MSEEKQCQEIKWYDKKLLIQSTLVGLIFFAIFWGLAKRAEPPEGHVFERLPTIQGIYRCCEAGGRYSKSWVGSIQVNCVGFSYYQLGTGRNDCGLKSELDGVSVEVEQILIPTVWGEAPLVSRIDSSTANHYQLTDLHVRERWLGGSRDQAFMLAFFMAAIFNGAQLILIDARIRKIKGEKK